jgi:hypothetical protein
VNYKTIYASEIETDLQESIDWYNDKQPGLGVRFLQNVNTPKANKPESCGFLLMDKIFLHQRTVGRSLRQSNQFFSIRYKHRFIVEILERGIIALSNSLS